MKVNTYNENHIGFQSGTEGSAAVGAKPEENENWDKYYNYRIEDNGVVITKYIGSGKEIVIPDSIEGKPVVKIEKPESGHFGTANIPTSVTIPDTVTEIGRSAFHGTKWYNDQPDGLFYECEKLQSITITESVTSIGDKVFDGCHFVMQLHVKSDSYAEKYAKQNSLNFVAE